MDEELSPRRALRRERKVPREFAEIAPKGRRRMGMNAHANGGLLWQPLKMPKFEDFAVDVTAPRGERTERSDAGAGQVPGRGDEVQPRRARTSASSARTRPPRTASMTDTWCSGKTWLDKQLPVDVSLSPDGRYMEILSEHMLPGLAGGLPAHRAAWFLLLLRGLHPHHRLDGEPAREMAEDDPHDIPWRKPIASLNYLLTSHVWRQDHNGFSHQDPGFINHLVTKKSEIVRIYLAPDANCLLSVADHCLRSRQLHQPDHRRQAATARRTGSPWTRR